MTGGEDGYVRVHHLDKDTWVASHFVRGFFNELSRIFSARLLEDYFTAKRFE